MPHVQILRSKQKIYDCYICGKKFFFLLNKWDKRNLDGTKHVCQKTEEERDNARQQRQDDYRKRWNRWFWGYGPGAKYKKYGYWEQERERREEAYKRARQWRDQYRQQGLGLEKAGEILGLDHYTILKICSLRRRDYSTELVQTIKNAYRKLALKFHPDRNTEENKQFAQAKFIEITAAYERILN